MERREESLSDQCNSNERQTEPLAAATEAASQRHQSERAHSTRDKCATTNTTHAQLKCASAGFFHCKTTPGRRRHNDDDDDDVAVRRLFTEQNNCASARASVCTSQREAKEFLGAKNLAQKQTFRAHVQPCARARLWLANFGELFVAVLSAAVRLRAPPPTSYVGRWSLVALFAAS